MRPVVCCRFQDWPGSWSGLAAIGEVYRRPLTSRKPDRAKVQGVGKIKVKRRGRAELSQQRQRLEGQMQWGDSTCEQQ